MSVREQWIEELRANRKPKILIIDDLGEDFERAINEEIECICTAESLKEIRSMAKSEMEKLLSKYDVIFWDATYEEDGRSTIDLLEKLISENPEIREPSYVVVGDDVSSRSGCDPRIGALMQRVKALPNISYGGGKTKTDVMLDTIKKVAKGKGIKISECLKEHGLIGDDLLEICTKRKAALEEFWNAAKRLVDADNETIGGREPENEEERIIKELAKEERSTVQTLMHVLGQFAAMTSPLLYRDRQKRNANKLQEKRQTGGEEPDK